MTVATKTRLVNLRSALSSSSLGVLQPTTDRTEIRGAPSERGFDGWWRAEAERYREQNPFCEYCAAEGREGPAELVDHLYPHGLRPGMREPAQLTLFRMKRNWVASCQPCHRSMKRRAEGQGIGAIDALAKRLGRDALTTIELREAAVAALARASGWGGDV